MARVVAVDQSVVPPAYVVEIDGAERSTEATRLAPPPDPRMARPSRDAAGSGTTEETDAGVAADGVDDAARAFVRHDVGSTRVGSTRDAFATVDEGDELVANDDDDDDEKRMARSTTNATPPKTTPRLDPDARNPECRNEAEKTNARRERRAAFVEAHELAMRAAQFLDPERGDKRNAAECLRRALEALEAV